MANGSKWKGKSVSEPSNSGGWKAKGACGAGVEMAARHEILVADAAGPDRRGPAQQVAVLLGDGDLRVGVQQRVARGDQALLRLRVAKVPP